MKMKRWLWLFIFFLLILSVSVTVARAGSKRINEEFRRIATEMQNFYDRGNLDEVLKLFYGHCREKDSLKPKPKAGEKKKEFKKVKEDIRAGIYRWVVLSYIALDRPELADIYLKKLLVLRRDEGVGDYWLSIRKLAGKYSVEPRLLMGLRLGYTYTSAYPTNRYAILQHADPNVINSYDKDYTPPFSHTPARQMGIAAEYALTKNISICIQPILGELKFQYKTGFEWQEEENGAEPVTAEITHNQNLTYIEIPVLLKYQLVKSKLKPYLQIGGFLGILGDADKTLNITVSSREFREETRIDIKKLIAKTHTGLCLGAGVCYDTGGVRLELEVNYKYGLNNIANKDNRYENKQLMLGYYDIFDDMKPRSWDFAFKVLLPVSFKAFKR